jgi:hypothetical protein
MASQVTNRREGGFTSCRACSWKLLAFTTARDHEGGSKTARCADYCQGGGLGQEVVVVEGVKGIKFAPKLPGMYENDEKTGGFPSFLA